LPSLRVDHFRHHGRFYVSALAGIAVGLLPIGDLGGVRIPFGGSTFFLIYLASAFWLARRLTTEHLRTKASVEDEGIVVIVFITLAAITLSLGSLALLLGSPGAPWWYLVPAVANVPLGWAMLHTIMAFHYAHLYYSRPDDEKNPAPRGGSEPVKNAGKHRDSGGLEFPKTDEPTILDFVYYSFVVGMTAQVSDVDTTSREMRNTTVLHGIVSFFFNTVILAFAVNVVTR
jgi:uncharacterized membrane protein